jgi:orotate phosphoribosyltransferase
MAVELLDHLRTHAVRTDGPFTLRSGTVSSWYLDARLTTFDGEGAIAVGRAVVEALLPEVSAVGGMAQGADPIAVAAAVTATLGGRPLRAFSVRKTAKEHGAGGRLVGPVTTADRVAVVEDTTTTGGALLEAVEVIAEAGIAVVQAVALVDRSGDVVAAALAAAGIPYRALLSPSDLGVRE